MQRANYIGAPAAYNLSQCCEPIHKAYSESLGIFLVGSALIKRDFRDVDLRCILLDQDFTRHFPEFKYNNQHDALWALTCTSISEWLASRTGLPIDFQIQSQTDANANHKGKRQVIMLLKSHNEK